MIMLAHPSITQKTKEKIKTDAESIFEQIVGVTLGDDTASKHRSGLCLYWAIATDLACKKNDVKSELAAGTTSWKANHNAAPMPTHLTFKWEAPSPLSIVKFLQNGALPEMHCWVKSEGHILDASCRHGKEMAEKFGLNWTECDPPQFLFEEEHEIPDGWHYKEDDGATALAYSLAESVMFEFFRQVAIQEIEFDK